MVIIRTIQNLSYAGTVKNWTEEYVELEVDRRTGIRFLIPLKEIREIIRNGERCIWEKFLEVIQTEGA